MSVKRQKVSLPSVAEVFESFIKERQAQGIKAPTLNNYETSLRVFLRQSDLDIGSSIACLSKEAVEAYSIAQQEAGVPASTIAHYLRDLRVFIYWAQEQDLIPSFKIKLPKITTDTLKRYAESDLDKLLATPSKTDPYWVWREWVICNLAIGTGARISSLCNLKKADIDYKNNCVLFQHTKNGKQLKVPLSQSLKSALNKYLSVWQIDSDYLLISSQLGAKLEPRVALHSFDKFASLRGVESQGLHTFRHTFAFMLYSSGVDIVTIQFLLGHSSIEITRHYIGQLTQANLPEYDNPLDKLMSSYNRTKAIQRR